MSEEFLDLSEVSSSSQDLGGSCVAEPVCVYAFKAGKAGMLENDLGNAHTIQCFERWRGANKNPAFPGLRSADS
jgi:hypothetical protein